MSDGEGMVIGTGPEIPLIASKVEDRESDIFNLLSKRNSQSGISLACHDDRVVLFH